MRKIDADWIKKVLGDRRNLQEGIHKRILLMYEDLHDTEERIRAATFPGLDAIYEKHEKNRDLQDVLQREKRMYHQQKIETRVIIWKLQDELESINRIWVCYQALGSPAYDILHGLYVEKRLYHDVEESMGLNHRIFESTRKAAMKDLIFLYQSPFSNIDIINMGIEKETGKLRKPVARKRENYEQITLPLVPESGTEQEEV